jgi:hypothetical protein
VRKPGDGADIYRWWRNRHLQDYLPHVRFFERGIAHAAEDAEPEKGLQLCEEAEALGLGKRYAAKAHSIRCMI